MNITEKLLEARKKIKETSIKKEGTNTYSKYDYFTPSQVSELVNDVCQELKIITLFSLEKDEFGLYGHLAIVDTESKDKHQMEFQMRTEMPTITATNMTQQMGGCETYTKRYMLMSAFDITDNNLDFDSQDNRPKGKHPSEVLAEASEAPVEAPQSNPKVDMDILACTTIEQLERFYNGFNEDEKKLYKEIVTKQKAKLS